MVAIVAVNDDHQTDSYLCSPLNNDSYDKLVPSKSFGIQEILDCSELNEIEFEDFDINETKKLEDLEWLVQILCEEKRWEELSALFGSMDVYSTSLLEKLLEKAVEGGTTWDVILALLCIKRNVSSEIRDDDREHNTEDDSCYRNNDSPASVLRSYFLPSIPLSNRANKKSMRSVLVLLQICLTGWKESSNDHGSLNRAISFLLMDDEMGQHDRYNTLHPDEIDNDVKQFFVNLFNENLEENVADPYLASKESSYILKTNIIKDTVLSSPPDNISGNSMEKRLVDQFEAVLVDHSVTTESSLKIFVVAPNRKISSKEDLELVTKREEATMTHYEVHIFPDVSCNHIRKVETLSWDNTMRLCKERQFSELANLFGFSVRYNLFEKRLKGLFRHLVNSDVPHGVIWSLLQLRNDHHFMTFYKISTYAPFCLLRSYFLSVLSSNRSTLASLITLKLFLLSFYTKITQGHESLKQPEKVLEALYFILFLPKYNDNNQRYAINKDQRNVSAFESLQFLGDNNFRERHVDRYATIEDDISNIIQSIDKVLQLIDYDDHLFSPKHKMNEEDEVNPDCAHGWNCSGIFGFFKVSTENKDNPPSCCNIFGMFNCNSTETDYALNDNIPKRCKVSQFLHLNGVDTDNIFLAFPMLSNLQNSVRLSSSQNECLLQLYYSAFYQAFLSIIGFFKLDLPLELDDNLISVDKKITISEKDIKWESVFRDSVQVLGKSVCQCSQTGGGMHQTIKDGSASGVEVVKSNYRNTMNKSLNCMPMLSPAYSWDYLHHDMDNDLFVMKEEDRRRFVGCYGNYGLADVLADASCQTLPEFSEETILTLQREKENISAVMDILTDSIRIIEIKKINDLRKSKRKRKGKYKEPGLELVWVETSPDSPLLNAIDTVPVDKKHCVVSMTESDENKIIYNFLTLPEETRNTILKEIEDEMGTPNQVSWTEGANVVSACISAAVNLLDQVVSSRVSAFNNEIEAAGTMAKENIKSPSIIPIDEQNAKKVLTYTGETKRLSQTLKDRSKGIYTGLRDTSATALVGIGKKLGEAEVGKTIIPHRQSLEFLSAAGSVALSGLGAASIVYEMMLSTTEKVAKKSNSVAADVVRHKYGNPAGQAVEDIGEASYNTFRAVKFVSLLNQVDMSLAVARNTGKEAKYSDMSQNGHDKVIDMHSYHPREELGKRSRSIGSYVHSQQRDRHTRMYDDDDASSFNQSVISDRSIHNAMENVGRKYKIDQSKLQHMENLNLKFSRNPSKRILRRSRSEHTKNIDKNLSPKGYVSKDSCNKNINSIALSVNQHGLRQQ